MAIEISSKIPSLSNLVFLLDSSNTNSFVSGSTNWNDLGKNSINGTLTNGVSYSGSNLGSLFFDGVDDYVSMVGNSITSNVLSPLQFANTSPFSISVWFNWQNTGTVTSYLFSYVTGLGPGYYVGVDGGDAGITRAVFFDYVGSLGSYKGIRTPLSAVTKNVWTHVVCTTNSSNLATGMSIYLNGLLTTRTVRANNSPASVSYGVAIPQIATRDLSEWFKGNISNVSVFNKELSAAEVLNLYNITRKRYT